MSEINWSESETKAAHEAFKKAYDREIKNLMNKVRETTAEITEIDELWQLHDFLSARRHDIEGKYDYRYSVIIFVLARLLKEGWLDVEELQALERDKLAKITALSRM